MAVKKYAVGVTMDGSWDTVEDPNGEFIMAEDFEKYMKELNLDVITQGIDSLYEEVRGDEEGYDVTLEELDNIREKVQNLI